VPHLDDTELPMNAPILVCGKLTLLAWRKLNEPEYMNVV
jgi:hypothetical protein